MCFNTYLALAIVLWFCLFKFCLQKLVFIISFRLSGASFIDYILGINLNLHLCFKTSFDACSNSFYVIQLFVSWEELNMTLRFSISSVSQLWQGSYNVDLANLSKALIKQAFDLPSYCKHAGNRLVLQLTYLYKWMLSRLMF